MSGDEGWDTVDEYVRYVAPHLADRLTRWQDDRDVFGAYRIDEQLAKALDRKVWLPSGGSLVIDKTEAMTVIDVNTGKFTGQGGNLEETVTRNNLEAAEEIVRQLRLRDVGGIVVIDFIDMVLESNRELVLRRLLECLARDRTKHQVAEVTSLGLVQMTRKRVGAGLLEAFSVPCECCNGRGVIVAFDPETDTQASHHVHQRGGGNGGNGGNGSRGSGASPATVAARIRPDAPAADASAADASAADASAPTASKRTASTRTASTRTASTRTASRPVPRRLTPKPPTAQPSRPAPAAAVAAVAAPPRTPRTRRTPHRLPKRQPPRHQPHQKPPLHLRWPCRTHRRPRTVPPDARSAARLTTAMFHRCRSSDTNVSSVSLRRVSLRRAAHAGAGRSGFVDAPRSGSLSGRELPAGRAPMCKRAAVVTTGAPGHAR